ncbi:immunoglobulin-like domain-containing receptor 1 [Nerophis ophidion]|uniref:immunoglobulin-like domain-containing receptor 1 n=1 Tax=Nerophis ophidion TaxID=159077 RepID=UPI002ADFB122|nr:immunoglobulin-like domain-containing receptor 1 [Nerophis ophidion]
MSSTVRRLLASAVIFSLLKASRCIQVIVSQQDRSTFLFGSVILRCDYSTSANPQDVLLTWRFKSFCKDPVLEYYSTSFQSSLQLGQDPANDCPDRQRTVRTIVQKRGSNEPIIGADYRERRISIQNKADLVINEVMWEDNGVYFCAVDAAGDTTGDSDKEVKLIVYHWLTVLLIILGIVLLLILLGVCWCQCCPQKCCCYVRCPCCPQKCCCPEKAIMQHRMMKDAQRAMAPWMGGQVHAPMSHQINPMLYAGSTSGKSFPLKGLPLPPPQSVSYSMPPPSGPRTGTPATHHMLDYMESQVRGMDMTTPLLQPQPPHMHQLAPPPQQMPMGVPYSPGPPSMISGLGDGPTERRVITLPPIREPQSARAPPPAPKTRPPSSSDSSRGGFAHRDGHGAAGRRYPSPPRSRGLPRSYSQESLDGRLRGAQREAMSRPRSRSRDNLFDSRSRGRYSPPPAGRRAGGSWSSEDEDSSRRGGGGRRGGGWGDKAPSYTEYEPGHKPSPRRNQYSVKSSRSGTSVVI